MAVNIDQLAANSAAQGQQMLDSANNNANDYKNQYNTYQAQADAANKQVGDYTNYMANEGSAGNQYHNELGSQLGQLGYDQGQMTAARGNLNQATGALSAYSDFANTAASKWGLNAGGFAAANSGALSGLNNNIASNQNVVNGLQSLYTTAQTGANQFTGQVVQGEQNTLAGYQQSFSNATNLRDSAAQQMQFWSNYAQQQGQLNAQEQQAYANSKQLYAAAQQAMAQSSLLIQQSKDQELKNQQTTNYMGSSAYQDYLNGKRDANGNTINQPAATPAAAPSSNNPSAGDMWNTFIHPMQQSVGNVVNWWNALPNGF